MACGSLDISARSDTSNESALLLLLLQDCNCKRKGVEFSSLENMCLRGCYAAVVLCCSHCGLHTCHVSYGVCDGGGQDGK